MRSRRRPTWVAACLIPILVGLVATLRSAWVCDDAFISFRYVDNFESGLGLVYNAGERVEGYTHFLWVVLLAALHRTGIDRVDLGRYLPVVFQVATLAILFVRALRRASPGWMFLPVAAWGVALHRDMQIWGSGGLETAAFTCCVTAAVLAASTAAVRSGLVATLAALAALLRPEGLLVGACIAVFLAWRRRGDGAFLRFALVWVALLAPLFVWRRVYYNDWLPNTFYAKSAAVAHWGQGWSYVSVYFSVYPILLLALALAVGDGIRAVRRGGDDSSLLYGAVSIAMLLYVVRIGGDFMFARFLIPVTPLLYVVLEETIRRRSRAAGIVASAIVVAATVLSLVERHRIFTGKAVVNGIVDEHSVYTRAFIEERRRQGEEMAAIFHGVDARICILGSQASFAYYARFPYVLERYGLTDRDIAHRPAGGRGRPGHDRALNEADLLARRVHFIFRGAAKDRTSAINDAAIGDLLATVFVYERPVMDSLRSRPGVVLVDYPAYLDSLVGAADSMTPEARRHAWEFFQRYYFARNPDPERYRRARAALEDRATAGPDAR